MGSDGKFATRLRPLDAADVDASKYTRPLIPPMQSMPESRSQNKLLHNIFPAGFTPASAIHRKPFEPRITLDNAMLLRPGFKFADSLRGADLSASAYQVDEAPMPNAPSYGDFEIFGTQGSPKASERRGFKGALAQRLYSPNLPLKDAGPMRSFVDPKCLMDPDPAPPPRARADPAVGVLVPQSSFSSESALASKSMLLAPTPRAGASDAMPYEWSRRPSVHVRSATYMPDSSALNTGSRGDSPYEHSRRTPPHVLSPEPPRQPSLTSPSFSLDTVDWTEWFAAADRSGDDIIQSRAVSAAPARAAPPVQPPAAAARRDVAFRSVVRRSSGQVRVGDFVHGAVSRAPAAAEPATEPTLAQRRRLMADVLAQRLQRHAPQ
ncbi:hypothetical protein M885DRAFT_192506 [Pelagophyceae sp. CCMP2097]|nr:hypothetical protein M885DRAFT_192506 [Pelagophyceae sp. CCMP2097]